MKLYGLSISSFCGVKLRNQPLGDQYFIAILPANKRKQSINYIEHQLESFRALPINYKELEVAVNTSDAVEYKAEFVREARKFNVLQS